ncbi:MATE family efflux transporter [Victivallis vadensis]|uniref:MATE family efflux transporter n=1 Tax=Victivallis vadensis TaxID=172901 RepID=UPI0023F1109B|nr:MATE family efflux transporter [Victivallis vadensis]
MNVKELFSDQVFNRKLLRLAFPITLQNLMLALVAAADAIMLGRVSQNAMAAVSLATQIQFVQNMLLGAIVSGVGILGAQYWGKRDFGKMGEIFSLSIHEAVLVSAAFFLGCRFVPEKLMLLFAHDPELVEIGAEYLRAASWSYLLTGISQCYLAIMRVSEHASRSAWISSGAVILNIVLNAVFIFGWFGVPAMGVRGAALATVIARVIELVWCIVSSYEKSFIPLRIRELLRFNAVLFRDFWHYTLPVLGSFLLWGIGFTSYTAIMGHLGPDAAAANAVAAVVRDLMCCLCNGIAAGAGILIGNELGAGNLSLGKAYGQKAMILAFLIGGLSTLVILSSIPLVSGCLELTEQAHHYLVGMFVILSVYMIGRCVCTVVINGIFASGGDTLFDVYSLAVCMWGIALPCAFLGAFFFHLPVLVVYACTCLDEVGKIPWVMLHYRKYKWVRNITRN